jgi:hypothetical protein
MKAAKGHKPKGGYGARSKPAAYKPTGGYGSNPSGPMTHMSDYASDGVAAPKTAIPTNKAKLFNMPKGKFTY